MATPKAHTETLTIAVTAYPVAAQFLDQGYAGFLSAAHLGVAGDPDVIISLDGVSDHFRMKVGTPFSAFASQTPMFTAVWFKLSGAGSVSVYATIEQESRR